MLDSPIEINISSTKENIKYYNLENFESANDVKFNTYREKRQDKFKITKRFSKSDCNILI